MNDRETVAPSAAQAEEELSRCIVQLLLREPFFGHLLAGVVRQCDARTPTAGVSVRGGKVRLLVNPDFFLNALPTRAERVAVVKHETLHLLFRHVLRMRRSGERRDARLWNLATDLVVNQWIGSPWRLPEGAITLETFPDLGLAPDQPAEVYYEALRALAEEIAGDTPGREQRPGARATNAGATDAPHPPGRAPRSAAALAQLERWHSDHDGWGAEADELGTQAAGATLDGLVLRAAQRVGPAAWGALPGMLREHVEATLARGAAALDWRRAVRIFSSSSRRTRIASTVGRASRRYGTFPGIRVKRRQRLAVALDTSASVGVTDLGAFFREVRAIWRAGAEVWIFECDAAVQRVYPYRGQPPPTVAGRGGTLFDPVFAALREDRGAPWDGCIYLTDGEAPAPRIEPPCKLLWLVTARGRVGPHLRFGRVARLGRAAGA